MFENITFFGSEIKIAKLLMKYGNLSVLVCEKKQTTGKLKYFCTTNKIIHHEVESLANLKKIKLLDKIGVIYGFGIILDSEIIQKFKYGIWNIHTGKLPENRGRHPIGWSLINGDKKAWVTIHIINDKIDQGLKLTEHSTLILSSDNEFSIRKRLENIIIKYGFFCAIKNYKAKKTTNLEVGKYWPSLENKWDDINPKFFKSSFLINLNKAKQSYGGYKVQGKKYKYCKISTKKTNNKLNDFIKLLSLDKKTMMFYNDK